MKQIQSIAFSLVDPSSRSALQFKIKINNAPYSSLYCIHNIPATTFGVLSGMCYQYGIWTLPQKLLHPTFISTLLRLGLMWSLVVIVYIVVVVGS